MKQLGLLKNRKSEYGGALLKTRKGRAHERPLDTRNSMHIVLRSSKAKGAWSFKKKSNANKIQALLYKFAKRYAVKLHSDANVGNHIHLHLQLTRRLTYKPFIRALTGSIAMAVTGVSRWNPQREKLGFWDHRPWSRVVFGANAFKTLKAYIQINQLEGLGYPRDVARSKNKSALEINYGWEFSSA